MKIEQLVKTFVDDSKFFLKEAKSHSNNYPLSLRFIKATIICSWCALEGWLNCITYGFGTSLSNRQIELHEKAFLLEKKLKFNNGVWEIDKVDNFQKTENKILFLLKRFGPHDIEKGGKLWFNFKKIEKIRNGLVHAKTGKLDIRDLTINNAELAIKTIIEIMKILNKNIFKSELRI